MKPIIKKQIYYSALLMRDDCEVRSFRIRGGTLRFFFTFFLLLLLGGAGGIAAGLHYWRKHDVLALRLAQAERSMGEAKIQLEQLSNVATLVQQTNATLPVAKNEEIRAEPSAPSLAASSGAIPQVGDHILAPLQGLGGNGTTTGQSIVQAPMGNSTAQAPATTLLPTNTVPVPPQPSDGIAPLKDAPHFLRITNFIGRGAPGRLRLRYDLVITEEQQQTMIGQIKYRVLLPDGTYQFLDAPVSETRFSIARRKTVDATVRVPQTIQTKTLQGIDIVLELEGGAQFYESFTLTQ